MLIASPPSKPLSIYIFQTRIVVLVDNPAMLSDEGFPDEPAPKKEYHVLSFNHVGLDLNGKKIFAGIKEVRI